MTLKIISSVTLFTHSGSVASQVNFIPIISMGIPGNFVSSKYIGITASSSTRGWKHSRSNVGQIFSRWLESNKQITNLLSSEKIRLNSLDQVFPKKFVSKYSSKNTVVSKVSSCSAIHLARSLTFNNNRFSSSPDVNKYFVVI